MMLLQLYGPQLVQSLSFNIQFSLGLKLAEIIYLYSFSFDLNVAV